MLDKDNDFWALRQTEFHLQSVTRERDALRTQLEWLQSLLADTQAKLESAYSRYHDISIASIDLVERAFDELPGSKSNFYFDARSNALVLTNPVNRARASDIERPEGSSVRLQRGNDDKLVRAYTPEI